MKPYSQEEFEARKAEAIAKGKVAREKGMLAASRAYEKGKIAAEKGLDAASKAAVKFQSTVTAGVHKVMGSEEYKKKALEVNARLVVALSSLVDSIKRRDAVIVGLRDRIVEHQVQLVEIEQ